MGLNECCVYIIREGLVCCFANEDKYQKSKYFSTTCKVMLSMVWCCVSIMVFFWVLNFSKTSSSRKYFSTTCKVVFNDVSIYYYTSVLFFLFFWVISRQSKVVEKYFDFYYTFEDFARTHHHILIFLLLLLDYIFFKYIV